MSFSSNAPLSTAADVTIGVNAAGDLYLGPDGNLVLLTGVDAVQQNCLQALRAQFGEMFLEPESGITTLGDVWLQKNLIKWEAVCRSTLAGINNVVRVVSFTYQQQGDVLSYTAQILTAYSSSLLSVSGILDQ